MTLILTEFPAALLYAKIGVNRIFRFASVPYVNVALIEDEFPFGRKPYAYPDMFLQ